MRTIGRRITDMGQ